MENTVPHVLHLIRDINCQIGKELSQLGGSDVFLRCSALEEIILDDRNENFVLEDGVLFSSDKKELLNWEYKPFPVPSPLPSSPELHNLN